MKKYILEDTLLTDCVSINFAFLVLVKIQILSSVNWIY